MSKAGKNDVVKTMDPRLDLTRGSKMTLEEGARIVNVQSRPASSASNNGLVFDNIDPGNPGFVVDRKIFVKAGFKVRLNLTNAAGAPIGIVSDTVANATTAIRALVSGAGIGITNGVRAFPLAQATRNCELILNSETYNYNLNEYVEPLMRYDNQVLEKGDYSLTGSYQDPNDYYSEGYDTAALVQADLRLVNANSPFRTYTQNSLRTHRGKFASFGRFEQADVTIAGGIASFDPIIDGDRRLEIITTGGQFNGANTTGIAAIEITFFVTEPIMLPITVFGKKDCRGFYGINDMRLSLQYGADLASKIYGGTVAELGNYVGGTVIQANGVNNVPAVGTGITLTSGTPLLASEQYIFLNILTPKITPELPASNIYEDMRIKLAQNTRFDLPAGYGTAARVTSSNISVGTIPKRVYLWAEQLNRGFDVADTYLAITNLSFAFNNQNVQFNNAQPEQLFLMCKRNGWVGDYEAFRHQTGSVFCLDFAHDVGLDDGDYPGRIGNYNMRFDVTFENRSGVPQSAGGYRFKILVVEEGYSVIQNQIATRMGGLAQVDPTSVPLVVQDYSDHWSDIYGGGFVDDLKRVSKKAVRAIHSGIKKGEDFYDKHEDTIKKGIGYAKKYGPKVAETIAMLAAGGMSEKEAARIVEQYGFKGAREMYGGGVKAGKMTSRGQMKKALEFY